MPEKKKDKIRTGDVTSGAWGLKTNTDEWLGGPSDPGDGLKGKMRTSKGGKRKKREGGLEPGVSDERTHVAAGKARFLGEGEGEAPRKTKKPCATGEKGTRKAYRKTQKHRRERKKIEKEG